MHRSTNHRQSLCALGGIVAAGLATATLAATSPGPGISATGASRSPGPFDEATEHFENHVRPIFIEHCVECHGGDKPKGDLRLDTAAGIRAGAYGAPIVEPGDLDASTLIEVVRYGDPLFAMPPKGKLPDEAIAALERWVELGATVPDAIEIDEDASVRWSLAPPKVLSESIRSEAVASGGDWIDAALERRLRERGIELSEPAEKGRWLRRVTFDLTGLPPSPGEWRAYMQTDGGRQARESVIDRLLESPAFGERWARRWLDLVRYAETRAHEFDYAIPNAFQYRDYVIRAFDADVPYDRFITEFLAGDLVEEPRLDPTGTFDESVLGTGAWFLGEEVHSPVEPRGDQADRIAHQVEVISKSVLGLGVACARCHDHKFDPISAEDYHALGGFALSTAARQVRFETDRANGVVAEHLDAALAEAQPAARTAVADALRAEAKGLEAVIPVAMDIAGELQAIRAETPPTQEAISEVDARLAAIPEFARPPLLIEDFEADTLDASPLGPWERDGEAFLDRPVRAADTASQTRLKPRGLGSLNSYAGHQDHLPTDEPFSADSFTGMLTSAPFPAARRYLHLLVNGGDGDGVRIELISAATGDVIAKVHGRRDDAYSPAVFDLSSHQGSQVRLRLVDEDSGGWGQIGVDQLVLSDSDDASVLDSAWTLTAWQRAAERLAVEPRLADWVKVLRSPQASRRESPLAWLREAPKESAAGESAAGESAAEESVPAASRTLVDYGKLHGRTWIPNGPGFGTRPQPAGTIILDADAGAPHVASIVAIDGAVAHPMWNDLRVAPGTATSRGGSFNWVQAGRTLHSPTFVSDHGRLAHLVRGRAKAFLVIAGHKMVAGPLHPAAIRTVDTKGEWRWVLQNVPSAAGLRAQMEFTALGNESFEVAATLDLDADAPLPAPPAGIRWLTERALDGDVNLDSPDGRASWFASALVDAADLVEEGGVPGRAVSDAERLTLLGLAELLCRKHAGIRSSVSERLEDLGPTLMGIRSERALTSALAPAAIDLEGVDERVLDRGSWRAPGAPAPRRAPSALRVSSEPLAANGEGSGRLALAHSLLNSPTRIVQRVWVNRLWQAMFARGLVTTPDDFGAMGANPSHPEILDQLCLDFEADRWSTKRMLKRLALTAAYGRSTTPTPSGEAEDPTNVGLARMHVRRLEAEEIRDALLAVSGELKAKRFGPPVPIHLTKFMNGRGRPGRSGPLDGAGRRSIYLEIRRNFPHPFLSVFDWPPPSTCRGLRSSSNVPAQALALLNDPFVEERAEHLAREILGLKVTDEADAIRERVETLWLRVLGRMPTEKERALAAQFSLSEDDSLAAWTDLSHVLFNVKDFLFLR